MSENVKDIEKLADSVVKKSQVQEERVDIDSVRSLNVVNFVDGLIAKAISKNELKEKVVERIQAMVSQDDEEVTFIGLIRLLEAINKSENDFSLGIANTLKDLYQIRQEGKNRLDKEGPLSISAKDFASIKKLADILERFGGEFPELEE